MSHAATKWAFDQPELHRDMKPSEWAVLMVLADCHNPINGCFPSQDHICSKTNLTERAVRDQLSRLRERGLINWDIHRENGKRGSNRYALSFETGFQPANSAACSTGKNEHELPANSDSFNRQNLPPNLVKEPVKEPLREACASEKEDLKAIKTAFWRVIKAWPGFDGMPKENYLEDWLALTPEERIEAEAKRDDWFALLKAQKKSYVSAPSTYFSQKLWKDVPDKSEADQQKPARLEAKPFGKLFGVEVYRNFLTVSPGPISGPTAFERSQIQRGERTENEIYREKLAKQGWGSVEDLFERASMGRSIAVSARYDSLCDQMESVGVGSDRWFDWQAYHAERGWRWYPSPDWLKWVCFPAGGPDGLKDFETALRGIGDDDGK
ncbi:helix-turn-helix domain-containing protein [Ochrobactrum sp. S46]|nr:helix-turn-helix domain-containing protein [Ochrobactrum sp. S45]MBK0042318.1 helix-turn-helix domain-containing protein [Ochrobactrum sp. S46]